MSSSAVVREAVLDAIREVAESLGKVPSRRVFTAQSGITESQILAHFDSWREAVLYAGLQPHRGPARLTDGELFEDWAKVVRTLREIPTIHQFRRMGKYSPETFMRHFGPWIGIPSLFRTYAEGSPQWADVLALLPAVTAPPIAQRFNEDSHVSSKCASLQRHRKLDNRPMYGNPIDFRGLRHEPVNENGVILLFGMVALELGYSVEAVQAGFPDCEAKRQIAPNKWQAVQIEFEFESRNFRDHGHSVENCDVIVCWRHNWQECPLEVVELQSVIQQLSKSQ